MPVKKHFSVVSTIEGSSTRIGVDDFDAFVHLFNETEKDGVLYRFTGIDMFGFMKDGVIFTTRAWKMASLEDFLEARALSFPLGSAFDPSPIINLIQDRFGKVIETGPRRQKSAYLDVGLPRVKTLKFLETIDGDAFYTFKKLGLKDFAEYSTYVNGLFDGVKEYRDAIAAGFTSGVDFYLATRLNCKTPSEWNELVEQCVKYVAKETPSFVRSDLFCMEPERIESIIRARDLGFFSVRHYEVAKELGVKTPNDLEDFVSLVKINSPFNVRGYRDVDGFCTHFKTFKNMVDAILVKAEIKRMRDAGFPSKKSWDDAKRLDISNYNEYEAFSRYVRDKGIGASEGSLAEFRFIKELAPRVLQKDLPIMENAWAEAQQRYRSGDPDGFILKAYLALEKSVGVLQTLTFRAMVSKEETVLEDIIIKIKAEDGTLVLPKPEEVAYHRRLRNKVAHENYKVSAADLEPKRLFYEESLQLIKTAIKNAQEDGLVPDSTKQHSILFALKEWERS